MVFRIKICGVTREADLEAVAEAGADAVGINLVPTSKRYVAPGRARELAIHAKGLNLTTIIVVMDPEPSALDRLIGEIQPDCVQLHGNEPTATTSVCHGLPIIKAVSWSGRPEESQLARGWASDGVLGMKGFLVDAYAPGLGGGSGRVADWGTLDPKPTEFANLPFWLAGGLTHHNVAEAIQRTKCVGVDTASGVESAPGIKDAEITRLFCQAARVALSALSTTR